MSETVGMMAFGSGEAKSKDFRNELSYDASFKKFFSRKEVLAGILLGVVPEFKTLTHSEVMSNIITSEISPINAELLCSEDVEESQKVIYDILTKVMVNRQEQEVHLLFDLEMQYNYGTSYPLMNRAIYYVSRLIAKQRIANANYKDLLPVRSTWIAVKGTPAKLRNQVIHFNLEPRDSNGELINYQFKGIDLIGIDYILLSEGYNWDEDDETVVKFLHSIFNNRLNDTRFNPYVAVTPEVEREVIGMNTILDHLNAEIDAGIEQGRAQGIEQGRAQGIEQGIKEGRAQGIEQGIKQGIKEGRAQGIEQGIEQGIVALILDNLEDGRDLETIKSKLIKRFGLTEEKAKYYIKVYGD